MDVSMGKIQKLREVLAAKLESGDIKQNALAEATGIDQASISRFYRKGEGLSAENFIKLSEWAGWQIEPASIYRIGGNNPKIVAADGKKLIEVYHIAGAGQGWEIIEAEPIKRIAVPISLATKCSFALMVKGDSMYPTLKSGSVVGVQRDVSFDSNEIYAINPPDGGLSIKRVIRDYQRDGYIIRSDNPNKDSYADVFIPSSLAENLIVGRAVWVWQGL